MKNDTIKWLCVGDSSVQPVISTPTSDASPSSGKTLKAVATLGHSNTSHGNHTKVRIEDDQAQESWGFGTHPCEMSRKIKGRHSNTNSIKPIWSRPNVEPLTENKSAASALQTKQGLTDYFWGGQHIFRTGWFLQRAPIRLVKCVCKTAGCSFSLRPQHLTTSRHCCVQSNHLKKTHCVMPRFKKHASREVFTKKWSEHHSLKKTNQTYCIGVSFPCCWILCRQFGNPIRSHLELQGKWYVEPQHSLM